MQQRLFIPALLTTMFLFCVMVSSAQLKRIEPGKIKVVKLKVGEPSADSMKVMGRSGTSAFVRAASIKTASSTSSGKYAAYKNGLEINAGNLGGPEPSLHETFVVASPSVSAYAITLSPGNTGLLTYRFKIQNGKKYMAKLVYYKDHYGALSVKSSMDITNSIGNPSQDDVEYMIKKTVSGKGQDEFSFILSPYVYEDAKQTKYTAGADIVCHLEFQLNDNFQEEKGKPKQHPHFYEMRIFKLIIKEVDF